MPIIEGVQSLKAAHVEFDFAVDGGAISNINMRCRPGSSLGGEIPAGAMILGGYAEVDTLLAGSGASVAISSEAAGDIIAAAAVSGAPWSTTGKKAIAPLWTAATMIKTTARRQLVAAITGGALTGGKFRVVVFYY